MLTRLVRALWRRRADEAPRRGPVSRPEGRADPGRAAAACREAIALMEGGRADAAEPLLREAVELQHDLAEAHFLLGEIHRSRGEPEDAADCYELAVHFEPGHAGARFGLAALHKARGRHAEAAKHYRSVIERDPGDAAAHANLGLALYDMACYGEARRHCERAVELEPGMAEAHHNLGLVLTAAGEPGTALRHFRLALETKPRAEIASALGHAYRDLGRLDQAIACYDRALQLAPGFGDALINRACSRLLGGDFRRGWAEYEMRFAATGTAVRDFGLPRWNGEPLRDRTILVHAEQGLGDEIMFASCVPDLIAAGARVILECSERVAALFRRSFPQAIVHGGGKEDPDDWVARFAPVHCQTPIGSLPRWLRPEAAAFPGTQGYLRGDARRVEEWRARIGVPAGRLAVGISWRGGTPKSRGHLRSVPPELLAPLLERDVTFVSLQHGAAAAELAGALARLRSYPGVTENLDELAALVCALDLVVSVDNTNVHLAGALGRPVWVLLPASPEWRYGLSGDSMPWYPSARLFRQGEDRRWEPLIERVAGELLRRAGGED